MNLINLYTRILFYINLNYKVIVLAFFCLLLVTGLSVFDQYGLSWDEGMQWKNNGNINYNYIVDGAKESLLASADKYHGPAFEVVLVAIEKLFKLTDTRDVYLMRHLVNFIVFFISVIFFYFLIQHLLKNWKLAITGCIMYVLSPRIFAEAFYNSKDIILLCFFIISMYTMLLFHQKQTWGIAVVHALLCGFAIGIRITSVVLPALSLVFMLLQVTDSYLNKNKLAIKPMAFIIYFLSLIAFTILFWPVLWLGPVYHFKEAFKEMSMYQWDSVVLYGGRYIESTKLPWHYLPVWIFISTPFLYTVLFIAGLINMLLTLLKTPLYFFATKKNEVLIALWFFIPLLAVIVLQSVVYDAWRHVFFIYGAFLLLSLYGVQALLTLVRKIKYGKLTLVVIIFFSFMNTLAAMIKLHPFQNVYFNFVAGNNMKKVKNNFEMDYWGLSSRGALEYILKHDTASVITVLAPHTPGVLNAEILPENSRKRLRFTRHFKGADYYLGDYRSHKQDYRYKNEVFSVNTGDAKLVSVFKLFESEKHEYIPYRKIIFYDSNSFETIKPGWIGAVSKFPYNRAHSGKGFTFVDSNSIFSATLLIQDCKAFINIQELVLNASFWKLDQHLNSEAFLIVSIESKSGENYFWNIIVKTTDNPDEIGRWIKREDEIKLPTIRQVDDILKVYLLNQKGKLILIDDLTVEIGYVEKE
ncbi:MAG: glycosyltransferase family 39 protein [Bacteroidia bacterium]|nr:glycosyltransferase family 39 protein [Bacteroidia bacterium]